MAGPRVGRAEAVSARLLRLEARLARAERQLRAALALRGRLQALERRLKDGGALPVPAKRGAAGGGPEVTRPPARRVPLNLEDVWVQFGEREWRALRGWQRALRCAVTRSDYRTLLALGPDDLRRDSRTPLEGGNQPCTQGCEDGDRRGDAAETGTEDSVICVKQEEELCAADRQEEEEAGGAPQEPCPGLQSYVPDGLSWIKEEEEPHCPEQQDSEKEEISPGPSTVHDENTKRDPPADRLESAACDSAVPGRPGEKLSKDPSPGVMWDSQWNSEVMETNTTGSSLGGDARYERGFGEHLDSFSSQENAFGKRPTRDECERNSARQEHLPAPRGAREGETCPGSTCDQSLSEKSFHLPCTPGEKGVPWGAAPASLPSGPQPTARTERGQNPANATRRHDWDGLGGEQPSVESEENFPAGNPLAGSCWDHPPDEPEACSRCRQRFVPRGHLARQQQSQGRGKSYICSDCGKSFVCHSWLIRHQMTHTGERPYKCSECDKTYRRKDYLLNHQRRHSGQGLFQCPLCGKRFVLRRSLMKHQESHVQETHLTLAGWPCAEIRGAVMHSI